MPIIVYFGELLKMDSRLLINVIIQTEWGVEVFGVGLLDGWWEGEASLEGVGSVGLVVYRRA